MVLKADGTNGILQQYDYQVPTTGFSYTFAAGTTVLVMNPAGTLATGTITMPAAPADGMTITFSSTQTITALTVSANTGQSIVSAATVLPARQATTYVYRLSNTTWYPMSTVATNVPATPAGGSVITQGTVNAGGTNPFNNTVTSVTFTGIPSWAKRITVLFTNITFSVNALPQFQLGSGSLTTTGYVNSNAALNGTTSATGSSVSGHGLVYTPVAGITGRVTFENLSGNTWVGAGIGQYTTGAMCISDSYITLSGALDRIAFGTVAGSATFSAGSINILYE
jgi:hypothetical protein